MMDVQRTVTILIESDPDLGATLTACRDLKQALSPLCFNGGKPLGPIALQRAAYHAVKGRLNSQMTIGAIRDVAAAYASAKRNRHPITQPFAFRKASARFLVGQRGRDADFRADGTLSIWTVAGRKRLSYTVPEHFQPVLAAAKEIDSLTVIECDGRLVGRVAVTLAVPDPAGILPVGIDLNETNALVAVDADDRTLFVSGKEVKIKNVRTRKTRSRLQRKLAARKAEGKDTRSVRRALKRLGRKQRNRSRTFAQTVAKQVVTWAPANAVLVLEDLNVPQPSKKARQRAGVRRRLRQWNHAEVRRWITLKAEERGMVVALVNPAGTSQACSRCGLVGVRQKHRFTCPSCGFADHADLNAARTIRDRFTALRSSGPPSTGPEARPRSRGAGKLAASAASR